MDLFTLARVGMVQVVSRTWRCLRNREKSRIGKVTLLLRDSTHRTQSYSGHTWVEIEILCFKIKAELRIYRKR